MIKKLHNTMQKEYKNDKKWGNYLWNRFEKYIESIKTIKDKEFATIIIPYEIHLADTLLKENKKQFEFYIMNLKNF